MFVLHVIHVVLVTLSMPADPSQITSLDLHSCNIHDAGARDLAAAISANTTLQSLNLRSNYLTDDCIDWSALLECTEVLECAEACLWALSHTQTCQSSRRSTATSP